MFSVNGNSTSSNNNMTVSQRQGMQDKFRRRTALPQELLYVKNNQPLLSPEHMPPPARALTRVPSAPTTLK